MDEKFCETFLLCDPGWYVQRNWYPEWMGRKHTHTHINAQSGPVILCVCIVITYSKSSDHRISMWTRAISASMRTKRKTNWWTWVRCTLTGTPNTTLSNSSTSSRPRKPATLPCLFSICDSVMRLALRGSKHYLESTERLASATDTS